MQTGFRTIGPKALDNYVGTDIFLKDVGGRLRHGVLADHVPNRATVINDIPESDFYIHLDGFYFPLKHGDTIRVRQNSFKPHASFVRDYIFVDESD